jgi:hypothetical protein
MTVPLTIGSSRHLTRESAQSEKPALQNAETE